MHTLQKSLPLYQPIIKNCVISSEYKYSIKPTFRKEATPMILYNIATFIHSLL